MANDINCSDCIFCRLSLNDDDKIGTYCQLHWVYGCKDFVDYINYNNGQFLDKDGLVVSLEDVRSKLNRKVNEVQP